MKLLHTIIITACMIAQATLHTRALAMQQTTTSTFEPAKTKIFFDFDDVLAQKDAFFKVKIASQGLGLGFWPYVQGLKGIRKSLTKDANGNSLIVDDAQNRYNGSTLQLIQNGIQYPALRPYIAKIIQVTGDAHTFIDGIPTLLDTLKSKGYSLNIATNKGNIDLDNAIDGMLFGKKDTPMRDFEEGEKLNLTMDKVLVHYPKETVIANLQNFLNNTPDKELPESFKRVINNFIQSKNAFSQRSKPKYYFTEYIKPEKQYFKKMFDLTAPDDTIIFFDDKKVNVEEAQKYGLEAKRKIVAVQVKSINDMVAFLKNNNIITQKEASTIGWHAFGNKINRWLGYPNAHIFSIPSLVFGAAMFYLLTKVDKR